MAASAKGADRHKQRLKKMGSEAMRAAILRGLYAGGQAIEVEAEISITTGSISGRGHVPSAPGEPPNADTRLLDTNIETRVESVNPPRVVVASKAPYAAALEFGTSRMAERPYMRPATAKMRPQIEETVRNAVRAAVRAS